MNTYIKKNIAGSICFCAVFVTSLMIGSFSAMADTVISSVSVSGTMTDWEDGEAQVPIFTAPTGCDLEMEWISSESAFAPGKNVNARITLTAEEGYRFSSNPSVSVYGATVSSKTATDEELVIRVKVGPLYYKLGTPEQIGWASETSSVVKWSSVKYATEYRVKIYHDDSVIREETVKTRSYDAGKYFNGDEVAVSVTAIASGSSNSKYIRQGEEAFVNAADVNWDDKESTYGVWDGNRYRISDDGDDSVYAKGWVEIFGKWYYFNENEYLQTGWIQYGAHKYYSDKEGVMQTGWFKENDAWYFFRSSGEMATGWLAASAPGTWYYLGADGIMKKGWVLDNQKWYFMGTDGTMLKGWQSINNNWYYFHDDGRMALSENIDSYYVNGDGIWIP